MQMNFLYAIGSLFFPHLSRFDIFYALRSLRFVSTISVVFLLSPNTFLIFEWESALCACGKSR